ncbi:hypothetical protein AVEN_224874-1 [Araneus ventricosus]|uniref:Uncharacterized protein n=1 Tax=Araneus ventricosus TaxID=182803 RepID=A0A4Y2GSL2_ARAVE|nr:hypothetical protein AVEN_224874-1 [Araneus ventricosus]
MKLESIFNFRVNLGIVLSSLEYQSSVTKLETRKLSGVDAVKFSKSGPFHHKSLAASAFTSSPREMISAGLHYDGICFHWKSLVNCWIWDTRLQTKVLRRFGEVLIHARAIVESDHNCTDSICIFRADMTF